MSLVSGIHIALVVNVVVTTIATVLIWTGLQPSSRKSRQEIDEPFIQEPLSASLGMRNFSTTVLVDQTPEEVLHGHQQRARLVAECDRGDTDTVGPELTYRVPDVHYSRLKVTQLVSGEKVAWRVMDPWLNFKDPH